MSQLTSFESVAVSTRIRLARNFKDYPFPGRLLKDKHAAEQAHEIVRLIAAELEKIEDFALYEMNAVSEERAAFLTERYLISRDLIRNRAISAALVSHDESISVMLNEEAHVREQYFTHGFDLKRAYERIAGIDDVISESIPFAFDDTFGYLTACPTNLGTGLRASVMLFLPAVSRRGYMRTVMPQLTRLGLTVRGAFGEGSGSEGDLFQVSNEVTLGVSEGDILSVVEQSVGYLVEMELLERARMKAEENVALEDRVRRAYGVLTNCRVLDEREFMRRVADVKLGIALGYFSAGGEGEERMRDLDALTMSMRPANINRMNGAPLDTRGQDIYRAEYTGNAIRGMQLES